MKTNIHFFNISPSVLPRMRNFPGKICVGNQNFVFNNFFLGTGAVYEVMWKITVQPDRPQMTI